MQEFCPLCAKNGVKTKVKAYQLNLQEAVFMCSSDKCTWPVGHHELTFINRSVGKDWTCTWDDAASKHLKNENDMLLEFSAYTPPQTPGNEATCKDAMNCSMTVPDKGLNPMTTLIEENVHRPQEFSTVLSKACDFPAESVSINNRVNLKPKLVVSKPVNFKLEKLPAKGYVFIKSKNSNEAFSKNDAQLVNCKNDITSTSNSLVSNSVFVKTEKMSPALSTRSKAIQRSKFLTRRKARSIPYEKFDFNDLVKQKTDTEKACKVNLTQSEKREEKEKESSKAIFNNNTNACSVDKFDLNELLYPKSTNVNGEYKSLDLIGLDSTNIVDSSDKSQSDFDSILNFANSSSVSDGNILENGDLDLQLEDLLTGFSDELSNTLKSELDNSDEINNTLKSELDNSDDSQWIYSLFE